MIAKRNKNRNNDAQTRTIEQNKKLENDKSKEDDYDGKNQNDNLDSKIIRVVDISKDNSINADIIGINNILDSKDESINAHHINKITYNIDDNNNNIIEDEKNNEIQFNQIQNITDIDTKTNPNEQNGINQQNENTNNIHEFNGENNFDENTFNKNNEETINNNTNNNDIASFNNINNNNDNKVNHIEGNNINVDDEMGIIRDNIEILKNKKNSRKKKIYKNIDLKYELINNDIIRSIEFINTDNILICTLENISVYKMNSNYELIKEYDIKEFNYRINYATQLSNGDLVICSLNYINIIRLSEDESLSYTLVQKISGRNDSYNINKVIEIKGKNYLISCDKNNLIIYAKNGETNLYEENNFINIDSEVKCLEAISDNIFVTLEPEKECVIFYDIENINNIYVINNIKSSFGRYVISYLNQYNCIFVTGRQGIYLISCEKYELITFFKVDEWISSISYDYYNDYLICGTWKKNTVNDQKVYNLIIYEIVDSYLENKPLDNMNIREVDRKNNIHSHDIVVIKPTKEGFILTGSNDRTIKVWKYI